MLGIGYTFKILLQISLGNVHRVSHYTQTRGSRAVLSISCGFVTDTEMQEAVQRERRLSFSPWCALDALVLLDVSTKLAWQALATERLAVMGLETSMTRVY